jgi:hypothetical protein
MVSNPVVWTDPSGQVVDDGDGGGRGRCIPIVERWDPFLQACVSNLGPPPPNNRLTNDAARSYAQAFDDLVGAPAADAGGILTTEIAIPYPGIGGFPRVGLPRIGLTPAQRRAAVLAALVALGCTTLTGDQADVRTRTDEGDSNRKPTVRVRHYSQAIASIRTDMRVRPGYSSPFAIWAEFPIITPYEEKAIQATTTSFFRPLNGRGGFVEFNVDLSKWPMEQDPNLPHVLNAKMISLFSQSLGLTYIGLGFPLTDPGVTPIFFDWKGDPL